MSGASLQERILPNASNTLQTQHRITRPARKIKNKIQNTTLILMQETGAGGKKKDTRNA